MPKTILIVEDEENLVELLKYRLEANGYKVETALDGQEGLDKIKKLKPDLIILDFMMPKMNGFDVCRLAKADKTVSKIPIIMLTAYAQREDVKKAKKAGANAYITKPFEARSFLEEIKKLLK